MIPYPLAAQLPNASLAVTIVQALVTAAQLDHAALTKGENHGYYAMLWATLRHEDFNRLLWSVADIQRGTERAPPMPQLNGDEEDAEKINRWLNSVYLDLFGTFLHNFDYDGSAALKRFSGFIEKAAAHGDVDFFASLAERLRERDSRHKGEKRLGIAAFIRSVILPCMLPPSYRDAKGLRARVRQAAMLLNRPETTEGDMKTQAGRDRVLSKAIARELAALRNAWDRAPEWTHDAVDWPLRLQDFGIFEGVREGQNETGR